MQNLKSKFKIKISFKAFYFLLIFLTFEFLFLNLDKAEASALSLAIDPPIITVKVIPPANLAVPLNIQNKENTQITLQIQLKPFKAKGENGELEYSRETLEILKDIQILDGNIPIKNVTLGPKQQKNLNLSINVLQNAKISARPPATSSTQPQINQAGVAGEVGQDYYFSVIFVSTDSPIINSNSSVNQVGIATNVLLSVGSKEPSKAVLEEFSSNIFFEKGPVPLTVRVKNIGTHFLTPKGEIIIKNMFGQIVGKLDLTNVNILSNSIRAIPNDIYMQELRSRDVLSMSTKSSYDFRRPIALWKESFLLGLYTATLNIAMSDEGPLFTRTTRFFAFPFQILIIILIIVAVIIVVKNRLKLYTNKDRT